MPDRRELWLRVTFAGIVRVRPSRHRKDETGKAPEDVSHRGYASVKPLLIADPAAQQLNRVPNSVDTLEPNDRFVLAVNKLPLVSGVPYHSIIGDRGRGDTPNSSDGVVPYWSSHLYGAQSELIVPSDHMALRNPEAIKEVERILKTYP